MNMDNLSPRSQHELQTKRRTLESIQVRQLSEQEWVESLNYSDLSFCPHKTFQKLLQNPRILNKVALNLLKIHGCLPQSLEEKQ